jgi:hypothetical protein
MMAQNSKDRDVTDPSMRLRKALLEGRANTELMIRKLKLFEGQLDEIESDLRPLQNGTQRYSVAKENISKTLLECGKTYEYFRIASEVKHIATAPYSREREREIFDGLDRLSKAKSFFEKHREMRSSGTMLSGVDNMLKLLEDKCVLEITSKLSKVGSVVSTHPGDNGEPDQFVVTNPLGAAVQREVQTITEVLDGLQLSKHLELSGALRLKQAKADMKKQEDSRKTLWEKLYSDDFPFHIRNNNPLQQYLAFALELLRGEQQLWGVLFAPSPASASMFTKLCHAVIDGIREKMAPFMDASMYKRRARLVHQNNVFLIRLDMLDVFMMHYHSIYEVCKPDFRKDSSASLALNDLRNSLVLACAEGVEVLIRSSSYKGPILIPSLDKSATKAAGSSHSGAETEVFSSANAGEKCDLQPLTNDTLHCCGQLLQYGKLLIGTLNSLARDIGMELPIEAKSHSSLVYGILANVRENLKERGEAVTVAVVALAALAGQNSVNEAKKLDQEMATHSLYETGSKEAELQVMTGCAHLFLANNFSKVNEFLEKQVGELHQCISSKLVDAYCEEVTRLITQSRAAFCETIARTVGMHSAEMKLFEAKYKSTTDKTASGRLIKGKFSTFNSGLEALLAQQGAWRVSSAKLRDDLGRQLADTVIPVYRDFYGTYSKVQFTKKHLDQYIRFTAEDAKVVLERFFGGKA